jgi:hypothetical protein
VKVAQLLATAVHVNGATFVTASLVTASFAKGGSAAIAGMFMISAGGDQMNSIPKHRERSAVRLGVMPKVSQLRFGVSLNWSIHIVTSENPRRIVAQLHQNEAGRLVQQHKADP